MRNNLKGCQIVADTVARSMVADYASRMMHWLPPSLRLVKNWSPIVSAGMLVAGDFADVIASAALAPEVEDTDIVGIIDHVRDVVDAGLVTAIPV